MDWLQINILIKKKGDFLSFLYTKILQNIYDMDNLKYNNCFEQEYTVGEMKYLIDI